MLTIKGNPHALMLLGKGKGFIFGEGFFVGALGA
jgi:hypothetical protein